MIYAVLITVAAMLLIYMLVLRPMHLKWGAKDDEVKMVLPGDEINTKPNFNATRAISIMAPPDEVWRWIIQIGSGRAGWYSIDWIDNGNVPSSTEIIPEFQEIFQNQFIPFTPDNKNGMWVLEYVDNDYILWIDKAKSSTWLWKILPEEGNGSRLITRLRTKYFFNSIWLIYFFIYDIGDIIMMKKCMKGIKSRAEKNFGA
jgi:hypothetical protein